MYEAISVVPDVLDWVVVGFLPSGLCIESVIAEPPLLKSWAKPGICLDAEIAQAVQRQCLVRHKQQ